MHRKSNRRKPRKHKSPPKVSGGELRMRGMLAQIFPHLPVVYNDRPPWLRGCELDVWYFRNGLAFEFQGQQHDHFCPTFHKNVDDFTAQAERDRFKAQACRENRILLIEVRERNLSNEVAFREYVTGEIARLSAASEEVPQEPKRGYGVNQTLSALNRSHRPPII